MSKNIEQKNEKQEIDTQKHKGKQERVVKLTEEEYNQLKQEVEQARQNAERILRIQADFENSLKRLEREKQEFLRFANKGLIVDLLNVVDDLERSLQLAEEKHEDFSAFLKGIEMILAHLYDLLKKQGLTSIETKGKIFNPDYHEALLKVETNDFSENTVVEELQKGYLLNDRVIRTAKVKVAKQPPPEADSSPQANPPLAEPSAKEDKEQKSEKQAQEEEKKTEDKEDGAGKAKNEK